MKTNLDISYIIIKRHLLRCKGLLIQGISGHKDSIANKSNHQKKENIYPLHVNDGGNNDMRNVDLLHELSNNSKINANIHIVKATANGESTKNIQMVKAIERAKDRL